MKDLLQRLAGRDLNLLVSLYTLMRFENVTEAAAHLGVTQSTMSHQLSRLRDMFSDELLTRRGRGMSLTPRAQALIGPLGQALKAMHDIALDWRFDPATASSELVIAMSDWASTQYAPAIMDLFDTEAPNLRLRLVPPLIDGDTGALDWDVDLAVLSTTAPLPADRATVLSMERLTCVARADHPLVLNPPDLARFLAARTVVVHSTTVPPAIVAEVERLASPSRRAKLFVSYFLALPEVLPRTDLIAIVPTSVAWSLVVDHGLGGFPVPMALPSYYLSLAWSPLRQKDPMLEWLRDRIVTFVKTELPARAARFTPP